MGCRVPESEEMAPFVGRAPALRAGEPMARSSLSPVMVLPRTILGPRKVFGVLKQAASGWVDDNGISMGAAVAFYSLLSMAPLLIMVITLVGLVIGRDEAQQLLLTQLSGLLGEAGAEGVKGLLAATSTHREGVIATLTSAIALLVGATTVFGELQDDLKIGRAHV